MILNPHVTVHRRIALLVLAATLGMFTLGMAAFAGAGVGADPQPPRPSSVSTTFVTESIGAVDIGDAVCVQRGASGPEPCHPS